jgi:hypothetical protein
MTARDLTWLIAATIILVAPGGSGARGRSDEIVFVHPFDALADARRWNTSAASGVVGTAA